MGGWNVILLDTPPAGLIEQTKKYVEMKLENYWLPKYLKSNFYQQIQLNKKTRMRDIVNDVLYLKNKNPSIKKHVNYLIYLISFNQDTYLLSFSF